MGAHTTLQLLEPIQLGPYLLKNRLVMAPLTRMRASAGNIPTAMNAEHYAQRSTAGLIVAEATQISPQGQGYPFTPGIHSAEQIAGWKLVTEGVHQAGGRIFLQLWHVGRVSHPCFQPDGGLPVAPSAIAPTGDAFTFTGLQPSVVPRALELSEIPGIIADYRQAAENALAAGFDGVEVHGANGYLLDQFLQDDYPRQVCLIACPIAIRWRYLRISCSS
jgi:N-ethylmaleimide reductase